MWDLEARLREFASDIEPTAAQKAAASASHNYLRDLLKTGQFGNRVLDTYLSGSYARDTALSPIDDVDIVVVVDPNEWQTNVLLGLPDPERILTSFASAIRYRYPNSSVHMQRRSVRLSMYHLDIDVVPAVQKNATLDHILLPDADTGEWIVSAPRLHTLTAARINQSRGQLFKPLVKSLKFWNNQLPQTANLKSFAIETLAATPFSSISLPSLQDGLRRFFDFLAYLDGKAVLFQWPGAYGVSMSWWSCQLPDLAGTGVNIIANLDAGRRERFLAQAVRSRDAMIAAENARSIDSAVSHLATALKASR